MNLFKSVFITLYSSVTMIMTVAAALSLWANRDPVWLGLLLVFAPMGVFFAAVLSLRNRARTQPSLPIISTLTAVGLILTAIGWAMTEPRPHDLFAVGVSGAIGYLVYLGWYSRFGRFPSDALRPGGMLPRFAATDVDGKPFRSSDLSEHPAVLLFFRGNWCPLCMAQIKEVAAGYRELSDQGAQVVLISPQPQSHSRRLAARFDVPLRFLVDEDNAIARRLGIESRFGLPFGMQILGYDSDTVLPTVIVTDERGRILLADQTDNYRVRPEPSTFVAALAARTRDAASG